MGSSRLSPVSIARNALQQCGRVGMARISKDLLDRSGLDDAAAIHDGHAMRHFRDDAEIVRDEDDRRAGFSLTPCQHRQHLRLHGDVEGRRRLICENEFAVSGHRHGDDRALAHPAGELMGILLRPTDRVRDVDLAQKLNCASGSLAFGKPSVSHLPLCDLAAHGQNGVEGGGRVLEDETDFLSPHVPQRSASAPITSVPPRTIDPRTVACRRQQAGDRQGRDALAGSGLTNDAKNLVGVDVEVDAAHDRHRVGRPPRRRPPIHERKGPVRSCGGTTVARRICAPQGLKPIVRATRRLSMSRVNPPTFLAATINPVS